MKVRDNLQYLIHFGVLNLHSHILPLSQNCSPCDFWYCTWPSCDIVSILMNCSTLTPTPSNWFLGLRLTCRRTTWAGRAWQPWGKQRCAGRALAPGTPPRPARRPTAPGSSAAAAWAWSPAPAAAPRGPHSGTPRTPAPAGVGSRG